MCKVTLKTLHQRCNYRHYNPTDGRWINREPIGEDGGFNLYDFVRNNPAFWSDSFGLSENSKDDCKCKDLLTADNVKKCLHIKMGRVVGEWVWNRKNLIPTCYPRIKEIPDGEGIKVEKSTTNIEVRGVWKSDDHCRKVAECYDKSFLDMVTVIVKGVYLDANKKEYTDYIFNGHLMGLTRKEHAAGMGNHNPESYATGTLLAYLAYNRQVGVESTVSGAEVTVDKKRVEYLKHRINFRK